MYILYGVLQFLVYYMKRRLSIVSELENIRLEWHLLAVFEVIETENKGYFPQK